MKKFINSPSNFVEETMEGILLAWPNQLKAVDKEKRILVANRPIQKKKVGIVTAGGSGHLPVFLGYVGEGLLDGCTVGNVFASPSSEKMAEMIRECDFGEGVLCLYGNYGGDRMNFEMACEIAEFDGTTTRQVRVTDDIASASADEASKRRGVAGMVYAFKTAGAAAEEGMNLDAVTEIAERTVKNLRTLGFATGPCIVPDVGKPTFTIKDDEMEVGMGIHGEPGIDTCKMASAEEVAQRAFQKIVKELPLNKGDEVSVMVNGLGATPIEELLIVYRSLHKMLADNGVSVFMPHIGEFATSMEMAGLSITFLKLDEQLKSLLSKPASSPFYTSLNK